MTRENLAAHYPTDLYDRYAKRSLAPYDAWLIRRLTQVFRSTVGAVLLDLGMGTATLLCQLARHDVLSGARLVGVDYFGDMVSAARRNVARAALADRITLLQADAHALPFDSGRVRYVLSRSTIHHWRDPVAALREIHRVLEPHGIALIYEISRSANAEAVARFNDLRRLAHVEDSRLGEKYTPEEVWQFVTAAGLAPDAELVAPRMGLMSLGMELRLTKA